MQLEQNKIHLLKAQPSLILTKTSRSAAFNNSKDRSIVFGLMDISDR